MLYMLVIHIKMCVINIVAIYVLCVCHLCVCVMQCMTIIYHCDTYVLLLCVHIYMCVMYPIDMCVMHQYIYSYIESCVICIYI